MLQPDNNFHQGCSRSTLHIANKTITCSANSSTGTYPSNGNDAINSVSYMSTVSLRNLFLASRFDIPEFVLLSASVQDTNSDIFLACNVDNSELQSTSACISIGKSTPTNDKSGSSATPKIAQNLQHTTWSTNSSRSFDLLHGEHNAEGPTLEINTTKGNNDKTVSSKSTFAWMTVDYSPNENISNVHIRSQSTRAKEMDFNNLVGEPSSMNIVKRTIIPETNASTSKHTKGQRSTTHSIKENSKTSQDFVNTFSFSTFLMDTNVHKTSDNSEHKTSTSRLTLKRPEATFGAVQQKNSTSIFSKGIKTKSPPYTISWSASQGNTLPGLTTRKIPLFSPKKVTNLPGYIPNQMKTPKTDHSTKFSDTNNSSSDSNVNDLKTTEHPVSDRFSTASNKELTTEASKNNKPQGNSYVLAIIGGVVAFLLVVAVIAVFIYTRKRVKNGPTRFKRPLFYLFDGEQKKNQPISSLGDASAGRNGSSIREDLQVNGTVMSIACSQDTEFQGHYEIYEDVDFQDNRGGDNSSSNFGSSSDRLYAKIKRVRESITKF
ncbi:hypothetical protein CHS0354_033709 [Potamilus streckersoni]|uniref:Uncharacterized protein n=1 Tax=Potamilus streckersoni TaxID=2493646 RepID=A0AAE0S2H9_9BIVA|nr:hypothetical protein CHS0354_033709 [Potamilus streckersoni]